MKQFYYQKLDGETGGPVDAETISKLIQAGLVKDDLVCEDGSESWVKFSRSPIEQPTVQRVAIVDLDLPFGSMVILMVKWAIASIPAVLILCSVLFLFSLVVGFIIAALGLLGAAFN